MLGNCNSAYFLNQPRVEMCRLPRGTWPALLSRTVRCLFVFQVCAGLEWMAAVLLCRSESPNDAADSCVTLIYLNSLALPHCTSSFLNQQGKIYIMNSILFFLSHREGECG